MIKIFTVHVTVSKQQQSSDLDNNLFRGQWCGSVGRAVASDTRGPGFESSHQQLFMNMYLLLAVCRKDEK